MPGPRLVAETDVPAVEPLGGLFVSMPKALQEMMQQLAEKNERSVQAEIRRALREHIERNSGNP